MTKLENSLESSNIRLDQKDERISELKTDQLKLSNQRSRRKKNRNKKIYRTNGMLLIMHSSLESQNQRREKGRHIFKEMIA